MHEVVDVRPSEQARARSGASAAAGVVSPFHW
jgi:hypothetical protein